MKQLHALLIVLCLLSPYTYGGETKPTVSCGPTKKAIFATISTVKSGPWSDPATWGGTLPTNSDRPTIAAGHTITYDTSVTVAGLQIDGQLTFEPNQSRTLLSTKNIIVTGALNMVPASATITQVIQFIGINEANIVGGGMDPIESDVGLWVMAAGKLNLQGTDKTAWTNAIGNINDKATTVTVNNATGWKVGDEIVITATANAANNYDVLTITNVTSNTITFNKPTTAHPTINNLWTAELGNLTRNVRIEGTSTGNAHIFIRSSVKQTLKNVAFRYLGQRKNLGGRTGSDAILGRYGLHFHHCMDGSINSIVQGTVMRNIANHAYVPHVSHGIEMRDNVAYDCKETPFWWDFNDPTHGSTWVHNLVVKPTFDEGSVSIDGANNEGAPTFGTNGFVLGSGDDNRCDSNVVAGQIGLETTNGAYDWEEIAFESSWVFMGNLAHNCVSGIRGWQNSEKNHVIANTIVYNSTIGAFHGAYANNYSYYGGYFYNAVFEDHAAGGLNSVRLENITFDGGNLIDYPFHMLNGPLAGARPVFMRNCILKNGKLGALLNESYDQLKNLDILQSNILGNVIFTNNVNPAEVIRVQPTTGQPYKLTPAGTSNIATFAPSVWGTGTGLTTEYYNGANFNSLAIKKIEPIVLFEDWMRPFHDYATGVHYKITSKTYSIRFTGSIQAQYTEQHTFTIKAAGGVRLWIDGQLIIDKWFDTYAAEYVSTPILLQASVRHKIVLEYLNPNNDNRSYLELYWQSPKLAQQIVPQTQLYPEPLVALPIDDKPKPPKDTKPKTVIVQTLIVNGQVRVYTPGDDKFELFNTMGQRQAGGRIIQGYNNININNLASGFYVLVINKTAYKIFKQ